jgi:hypothetical protein
MPAAKKLDLYKLHAAEYAAPRAPVLVTTKPAKYLAIAGSGDPDGPAFGEKVGALYAVVFSVKMARKKAGRDYKVAGLEGLWWGVSQGQWLIAQARHQWRWKLVIRAPGFITAKEVAAAKQALLAKGKAKTIAQVKLETLREGRCVQMLHVGPYMNEGPAMNAMLAFAKSNGLRFTGRHHEIYLSDPRRVKAEKLRTILRHPVR